MTPARIAILYLVISALWIALSDALLYRWLDDPMRLTYWQGLKGWFFIVLSALLVYALALRLKKVLSRELDGKRHHLALLRRTISSDLLTGFPTRRAGLPAIRSWIQQAKSGQEQFYVMLLDLDTFKQINDTLGHAAGDQLILAVSKRLQAALTQRQHLVRYGGNEFLWLCADVHNSAEADRWDSEVVDLFAQPFVIGLTTISFSARF